MELIFSIQYSYHMQMCWFTFKWCVSNIARVIHFFVKIKCLIYILETNLYVRVAQSVGHLTRKSGVLGSIPGLATYFRFSFRFFKKGSCQLLAEVCARNTG